MFAFRVLLHRQQDVHFGSVTARFESELSLLFMMLFAPAPGVDQMTATTCKSSGFEARPSA